MTIRILNHKEDKEIVYELNEPINFNVGEDIHVRKLMGEKDNYDDRYIQGKIERIVTYITSEDTLIKTLYVKERANFSL